MRTLKRKSEPELRVERQLGASTALFDSVSDLTNVVGLPVPDTTSIVQGSVDASKKMRFEVDGVSAGLTRVLTIPDRDLTIAPDDLVTTTVKGLMSAADKVKLDALATFPVGDATEIIQGSSDSTKRIRFEVDGLTTATTRVLTIPDRDFTLAGTDLTVAKAGDTMTGTLNLPANGLVAGTTQLKLAGGFVGVNVSTVNSILHVNTGANATAELVGGVSATPLAVGEYTGLHFGSGYNNQYKKAAIFYERVNGSAQGKFHLAMSTAADTSNAALTDGRVTIDKDGLVGVNNTSPAYQPDVTGDMNTTTKLRVSGTQVVSTRKTGWAAATGTATRTTFDTASVTLAGLAERVKALLDDLISHGLVGT